MRDKDISLFDIDLVHFSREESDALQHFPSWADASPLLTRLALQKRPRMRALVFGLQYEHAAQFAPHTRISVQLAFKMGSESGV